MSLSCEIKGIFGGEVFFLVTAAYLGGSKISGPTSDLVCFILWALFERALD